MKGLRTVLCITLIIVFIFILSTYAAADSVNQNNLIYDYSIKKIDNRLKERFTEESSLINVVIWTKDINNSEKESALKATLIANDLYEFMIDDLPTLYSINITSKDYDTYSSKLQDYIELKRKVERDLHTAKNNDLFNSIKRLAEKPIKLIYSCRYAPMFICAVNEDDIINIAKSSDVVSIYYYDALDKPDNNIISGLQSLNMEEDIENEDYGVWQKNTKIDTLKSAFGATGLGVKIGLLQNSVPDFNLDSFTDDLRYRLNTQFNYSLTHNLLHMIDTGYYTEGDIGHANIMLAILTGEVEGVYSGIAPRAQVYCTGWNVYYAYFSPIEDLIDAGVNVICASVAMGSGNSDYDYNARFLDYIISNSNVTICIATGNTANLGVTHNGAMAYNVIASGNIDDNNTLTYNDDIISYDCMYSSSPSTAYKPDLSAPGARAGTYSYPSCTTGGWGGTCAATAINSGVCALLMQASPILKANPMLLKSILMTTATNLPNMTDLYSSSSSIEPALLRNYGAGMVNATDAYLEFDHNQYMYSDTANNEYNYTIQVKQKDINKNRDIFISLCWLQDVDKVSGQNYYNNTNYTINESEIHTLELYDQYNIKVAASCFTYDKKQFIRYKPVSPGYYTVKVKRNTTISTTVFPMLASSYIIK